MNFLCAGKTKEEMPAYDMKSGQLVREQLTVSGLLTGSKKKKEKKKEEKLIMSGPVSNRFKWDRPGLIRVLILSYSSFSLQSNLCSQCLESSVGNANGFFFLFFFSFFWDSRRWSWCLRYWRWTVELDELDYWEGRWQPVFMVVEEVLFLAVGFSLHGTRNHG